MLSALQVAGCGWSARGAQDRSAAPAPETAIAQKETTPPPASALAEIKIDSFAFSPAKLTIAAGTRVTWINQDDVPHTATSVHRPRAFDSKTLDTGDKFTFQFTKPGTYDYFCAVHPHMTGQVIVK
jgi:plastocyanin